MRHKYVILKGDTMALGHAPRIFLLEMGTRMLSVRHLTSQWYSRSDVRTLRPSEESGFIYPALDCKTWRCHGLG